MPKCVMDKCCFFIDLKIGCYIIAYLELVISIVYIALVTLGLIGGAVITAEEDKTYRAAGIMVIIFASVLLIFLILFLIFDIVLLVGLHKNKPGHLKAYLIYAMIFLIIYVIHFITNIANGAGAELIIQALIAILINLYSIVIIRSMYRKMIDPTCGPAVYSA